MDLARRPPQDLAFDALILATPRGADDDLNRAIVWSLTPMLVPSPILSCRNHLVSTTGSGTKPASLGADDVADLDEVNDPLSV